MLCGLPVMVPDQVSAVGEVSERVPPPSVAVFPLHPACLFIAAASDQLALEQVRPATVVRVLPHVHDKLVFKDSHGTVNPPSAATGRCADFPL